MRQKVREMLGHFSPVNAVLPLILPILSNATYNIFTNVVTLTGTNLLMTTVVKILGIIINPSSKTDTMIKFTVPLGLVGILMITVDSLNGLSNPISISL